jgi:sigma-B regulation protein RsbU (phosphoserine phosphatase)
MTTAAVVAYYTEDREARISYAGHPPLLYKRTDDKAWSYAWPLELKDRNGNAMKSIPLAIELDTDYEEFTIPMNPGDRIFIYTDGIIDTPDPDGNMLGLERLKNILDVNATATLAELKAAVLKALNLYALKELTHDDVTMIALEIC